MESAFCGMARMAREAVGISIGLCDDEVGGGDCGEAVAIG